MAKAPGGSSSSDLDFLLADFYAEDHPIRVSPSTILPAVELICGSVGPFYPNIEVEIPLYLAVLLKKQKKCAFVSPDFLRLEDLRAILALETSDAYTAQLAPLPSHYFAEMALMFLTHAPDDLRDSPTEVRAVLEDILNVREAKLRRFLHTGVTQRAAAVRIPALTAVDVNRMREPLAIALGVFHRIGLVQMQQEGLTQGHGTGQFTGSS
eukprot:CAMPEP_0198356722 /NCGR_PEP_ID=MMETSP1450-20131203/123953_1 /TAXON_ID=753684 ORGANISM="Madagascaria erythrocladiodes, Strain CCMP3234" /NCGR_SAMPLE_ID=MMETSP1450 /ASSEMBLY_ACC=CAM_ASM_001115 /LENGTH=209 /DNA_ID=CAMNT_0044063255 /DNA_START=246 /DNA_END=871 /DNA_ORIENTATION=+